MSFLTDETLFSGTISDSDLIHLVDVSDTTQNAAGSSFKLTIGQLKAAIPNIYNSNGTLSGARVVTQAGFDLSFQGGNVGFGIAPDSDARTHIQGVDATTSNFALKIKNSASGVILYARNDRTITLLTDSYAVMGGLEASYPPEFKVGATRNIWWSSGSSGSALFIEDGTIQGVVSQLATTFGMITGTYSNHSYVLRTNSNERVYFDKGGQVVFGGFGAANVATYADSQVIIGTALTYGLSVQSSSILMRATNALVNGDTYNSGRIVLSTTYNNGGGSQNFLADIGHVQLTNTPTSKLSFRVNAVEYFSIKNSGVINMSSLPTSATGLSTGDLWNNSGVINII